MNFIGLLLRFLLGGCAVAGSAVIGYRLGGRVGGIFAAFPAVYASAVVSTAIGLPQAEAVRRTLAVSHGAFVGMSVNILCAVTAGWTVAKWGWKKGLIAALGGWLAVAAMVYVSGAALGWLR